MSKYKECPLCGALKCVDNEIKEVVDGMHTITKTIRCGYCGVEFIMDGVDFNKRVEAYKSESNFVNQCEKIYKKIDEIQSLREDLHTTYGPEIRQKIFRDIGFFPIEISILKREVSALLDTVDWLLKEKKEYLSKELLQINKKYNE